MKRLTSTISPTHPTYRTLAPLWTPNPGCVAHRPLLFTIPRFVTSRQGSDLPGTLSMTGKTAVRGGFGIFDSLPMLYHTLTLIGQTYPFFNLLASTTCLPARFLLAAFTSRQTPGKVTQYSIGSVESHPHRNYVMQWSLNVQRELTHDLTATIGYVGTHGVHQPFRVDDADLVLPTLTSAGYLFPQVDVNGNQCIPNTQCTTSGRHGTHPHRQKLNPFAGEIRYLNWAGSSFYDSLQLGVAKRLDHGVEIQGSFTWGKSIDNNSGVIAGDTSRIPSPACNGLI